MSLLLWYWAADSFPYLQLSVMDSWRLASSMWPWSSRWNECSRLTWGRKEHVSGASQRCEACQGSQGHQRSHHQVMPDSRVFHSFIDVVVVFHLRVWVMVQDLSADSPNLLGWKFQKSVRIEVAKKNVHCGSLNCFQTLYLIYLVFCINLFCWTT